MNIPQLRTFVAVARHGNISSAARELNRTPAAISLALKQLEAELGQRLFAGERKSRLSNLGEFVLDQASRELSRYDETVSSIERFARSETDYLAIGSVPTFATRVLPDVCRQFHQLKPNTQLEVFEMDSIAVRDAFRRGEIDVGIVSDGGRPEPDELLLSDRFGVVCHATNPLAQSARPIDWDTLASLPFIANRLCSTLPEPRLHRILEQSRLRVHNTASLLAMIHQDLGVTMLPRMALPDADREIAFLELKDGGYSRHFNQLLPGDRASGSIIDIWSELVVAQARRHSS